MRWGEITNEKYGKKWHFTLLRSNYLFIYEGTSQSKFSSHIPLPMQLDVISLVS